MLTVTRFVDVTVPFVPGAEAVTLRLMGAAGKRVPIAKAWP